MRLEGRIKMGYYPTPDSVVERIRSFIKFPEENVSILDPCCGEGLALKNLAQDTKATTYGIELDDHRAGQARDNLDHVLKGSYEDARISSNAFSCLFLNPPYDWDTPPHTEKDGNARKEKTFLRGTVKYLKPEGALIYIIPQNRLTSDIAKMLSYRFEDHNVFRFPDDEYVKYKQIVLFGVKKQKNSLNENDFNQLRNVPFKTFDEIPYSETPLYELPPSNDVRMFRSTVIDEKELEREVGRSVLWQKLNGHNSNGNGKTGRPPLPLHTGHLGLLLANGYLDGIVGQGEDRHIVRGKVEKFTRRIEEYNGEVRIEREVDSYKVSLKILKKDGEILTLM
jgi:tRNA1(Val) A37 N6-methylase TrmN6